MSRKAKTATVEEDELSVPMGNEMQVFTNLQENIKEGLHKDPTTLNIMKYVKEEKTRNFWMYNGIFYFGDHIYVPKSSNLERNS